MLEISRKKAESVADLLRVHPEVAAIFRQRRTACVGCYMAGFCTITEVARAYDLDEAGLRSEIRDAIADQV